MKSENLILLLLGRDIQQRFYRKICERSKDHINIIQYTVSTLYILNVLNCVWGYNSICWDSHDTSCAFHPEDITIFGLMEIIFRQLQHKHHDPEQKVFALRTKFPAALYWSNFPGLRRRWKLDFFCLWLFTFFTSKCPIYISALNLRYFLRIRREAGVSEYSNSSRL